MTSPSIVWYRLDLRLADNPALHAALKRGGAVIPVYIHSPEEEAPWQPGGASRWWLHQSLSALAADLEAAGSRLILRRGESPATVLEIAGETGAGAVFWNERYEPAVVARDANIGKVLREEGLEVRNFNGALLHEPHAIRNQKGKPYQVFTRFWRSCLAAPAPAPALPAPRRVPAPREWPASLALHALGLEPESSWADGFRAQWRPGEAGARAQLRRFLRDAFAEYATLRDYPHRAGTSRLSPHLHFGEITARQVWHAARRRATRRAAAAAAKWDSFLTELGWREFSHHLIWHFPETPSEPLRPEFKMFPWRRNKAFLDAWRKGRTGYPIVDAGMRELWNTGWMHNRVRMIVASFLVKDLMSSWEEGARWFWDTLVDADLAQNTLGWQWTAGCGADAAPYFRVFNPVTQGQKYDREGVYVRRWCPELSQLPDKWLHQPWAAPPEILSNAGVRLGIDYPLPVVRHAIAREIALEAFAKMKSARG